MRVDDVAGNIFQALPWVASLGRTFAARICCSAVRTPFMSPARPCAAIRVLYSRGPAATPARAITQGQSYIIARGKKTEHC